MLVGIFTLQFLTVPVPEVAAPPPVDAIVSVVIESQLYSNIHPDAPSATPKVVTVSPTKHRFPRPLRLRTRQSRRLQIRQTVSKGQPIVSYLAKLV